MTAPDTFGDETLIPDPSGTGGAPPFRAPVAGAPALSFDLLVPGRRFDDFEIVRVLGAGSFAKVLLARQLSLDRLVALKVSTNQSAEARTLASLEHAHIVQVFAEQVHAEYGLRLLCMQYVPGLTLAQVIDALARHDRACWDGRLILDILDRLAAGPAALDPVALEGRAALQACDFPQAVCRLGARLAEALAHAHGQGVLHRDIKPANILLNRYGRPFLADFNIALATRRPADADATPAGGTLGYMAPEHLDAFYSGEGMSPAVVDERSDVYSLGVVLYELLTGQLPFPVAPTGTRLAETLPLMAAERRGRAPSPRHEHADVPETLDRVVRRCLDPDPARRYPSAAELAQALDGCRELRQVEQTLPPAGALTRVIARRPFLFFVLLTLFPHFLGSAVNIPYNQFWIVRNLTPAQREGFDRVAWAYNLVIYPLGIALLWWAAARARRAWRRSQDDAADPKAAQQARRTILGLPLWAVGLSCLGWLPGALLFPLSLGLPIAGREFGHFVASFTISGLVALTYAYFGVQYAVLRVLYLRLWFDAADFRRRGHDELAGMAGRLRFFQILAGLIPLAGAVLLIAVSPDQLTLPLRLLLAGLIALGMAGFGVALLVSSRLTQVLAAFGR